MKRTPRGTRRLAGMLCVAVTLALTAACNSAADPGSSSSGDGMDVTLAQGTDSLLYGPIYVAEKQGFFKQQGLNVKVVAAGGGSKALTSVISGGADIVAGAFSDNVAAYLKGKPLMGFAAVSNQYANNLLISKKVAQEKGISEATPLADKLKALKGLKIGITSPGSATDETVRFLLEKAGLDPSKDANIIALSQQSVALASMQNDRVDAMLYPSPAPDQLLADGDAVSLINFAKGDVPELKDYLFITLLATKDYLQKNQKAALAVTKALQQAQEFIASSPDQAEAAMKTFFPNTDEKTFQLSFDSNKPTWAASPLIQPNNVQSVLNFVAGPGKPVPNVPFQEVVDTTFAEQAGSQ